MEVDWEEEEEEEDDSSGVGMVPNMRPRSPFQQELFWPFFMVAAGDGTSEHKRRLFQLLISVSGSFRQKHRRTETSEETSLPNIKFFLIQHHLQQLELLLEKEILDNKPLIITVKTSLFHRFHISFIARSS